jgi:DNA-binding Xre family transcriptional regulator
MIARKINSKSLKQLCWKRGMSVRELADKIGRSRVTVHRAAKNPEMFPLTYKMMEEELFHGAE